jgi:hypothetical protein
MPRCRVEVIGQGEFNAREWLRRDILWASLMSPYDQQLQDMISGAAYDQHMGSVSRQNVYYAGEDSEVQSQGFFNQGKNIAGLTSTVALFRACKASRPDSVGSLEMPAILEIQAKSIDVVLEDVSAGFAAVSQPHQDIYKECSRLAKDATNPNTQYGAAQRLLRASRIMADLACTEAGTWLDRAEDDGSSPKLTIHNGGHPRSAGPRVDMLQPILHRIIESDNYRSLEQ